MQKKRRATTLVYPEPDAHLNNHPPTQWRDRLSGSAERASASPFRRSRRRTENRREEETKTAVSVTTTWCLKRRETVEQRLACEAHTHFLVRRSRPHRTWGICTRRAGKLNKARYRLYRSQILQENMSWKALAEIYTMHSFAPFSGLNFFKNR